MPLDPAVEALLAATAAAGRPPLEQTSPVEARKGFAAMGKFAGEDAPGVTVTRRTLAGVDCVIATPQAAGDAPLPVFVWFHGGGWVIGSAELSSCIITHLAARAGCIVVSVDYRLAPEHKAPAALDDCNAVTQWVLAHAGDIGGDHHKVAVGGDSAGGNLAALVALEFGPRLCHQVLVYPVTDLTLSHPSMESNGVGYMLTRASMEWFVDCYIGDTTIDARHTSVSPYHVDADRLVSAPPALVITAEFDPLRDEGEAYAARLKEAGVRVDLRRYDGQIHGFFQMPAVIPTALEAFDVTGAALRAAFA